jgi:hypothetical protein
LHWRVEILPGGGFAVVASQPERIANSTFAVMIGAGERPALEGEKDNRWEERLKIFSGIYDTLNIYR